MHFTTAQTPWHQQQLRIVQTVMREPDIVGYDAKAVMAYLREANANCLVVNAGGIVDFFDNPVEMGFRNPFLTTENHLRDLMREARANDVRVIVRVDFRGVDRQRYEKNPDWFAANPDGSPKPNHQGLMAPCYMGEYANGHAVRFIRHIMETFDVDGVWENSLGFGTEACYCQTCRTLYRNETGKEIPEGADYLSPAFAEYRTWKAAYADAHVKRMRDTVKEFGEEKAFCAEIFGMFHASGATSTGIDLYNAQRHFDFLVSPAFVDVAQPDRVYDLSSYAASAVRFLKSLDKTRQSVLLTGNNGTRWRYVKAPTLESILWQWEAVSVGGCLWNCMFNGQHPGNTFDIRNAFIERDVYAFMKDHEAVLTRQVPVEDVGIFFSKASRDALGHDAEAADGYGVFIKGVERVLVDAHLQYNFIPDLDFTPERIAHLKLLILPNAAWMSDDQIQIVRAFVAKGGGLVASYETSLYDEYGRRRADFGLSNVFGVSSTGIRKDTASDCYQMIRTPTHPVLQGMETERTKLLINGGHTHLCRSLRLPGYETVCTYVPLIFNQPPEKAWITDMETDFPTITAGTFGSGRVVHFANQTDKLCHTNGHEDYVDSFRNAVRWAMQGAPNLATDAPDGVHGALSLETDAPDSVHVALTEQVDNPGVRVVSFVNFTGAPRRPLRQVLSVGGFQTLIRMPGTAPVSHDILKQDGPVTVSDLGESNGTRLVRIEIETLQLFTAIALTSG